MAQRAALYARVSTTDKRQDPDTQLRPLRAYARRRGFDLTEEYVDYASGRDEERPAYRQLLAAARRRHFDVVLVWRYDRFARSTQALVRALKEFEALGVDFISYQEQLRRLHAQDVSISQIAKRLGIGYGTAWNYVQALKEPAAEPPAGKTAARSSPQ